MDQDIQEDHVWNTTFLKAQKNCSCWFSHGLLRRGFVKNFWNVIVIVIVVNFYITLPSIVLNGKVIKKANYDFDYDVSKILDMFCPLIPWFSLSFFLKDNCWILIQYFLEIHHSFFLPFKWTNMKSVRPSFPPRRWSISIVCVLSVQKRIWKKNVFYQYLSVYISLLNFIIF